MSALSIRTRKRLAAAVLVFMIAAPAGLDGVPAPEHEISDLFRRIYEEVRTMPPRPGERFIRQEFFIGEGDDDTDKDIAVSIVLPGENTPPDMIVQITWMERDRRDRRVAVARSTKILRFVLEADGIRWEGDAFGKGEAAVLARGLLKAVRNKKRLLGLQASPGSVEPREYPCRAAREYHRIAGR
ncbi:MAG TPA: hypothetical protein PLX98_11180 [Candidatus Aminicenantes bacterium]|nr:hypothetical protein [Candidatus Aminicenantes bacterium]